MSESINLVSLINGYDIIILRYFSCKTLYNLMLTCTCFVEQCKSEFDKKIKEEVNESIINNIIINTRTYRIPSMIRNFSDTLYIMTRFTSIMANIEMNEGIYIQIVSSRKSSQDPYLKYIKYYEGETQEIAEDFISHTSILTCINAVPNFMNMLTKLEMRAILNRLGLLITKELSFDNPDDLNEAKMEKIGEVMNLVNLTINKIRGFIVFLPNFGLIYQDLKNLHIECERPNPQSKYSYHGISPNGYSSEDDEIIKMFRPGYKKYRKYANRESHSDNE